jgi:hypothetical protein
VSESEARRAAAVARQAIAFHMDEPYIKSWADVDSLCVLEIIMSIEDRLDVSIPINDVSTPKSISEMITSVVQALYPQVEISCIMQNTAVGGLQR